MNGSFLGFLYPRSCSSVGHFFFCFMLSCCVNTAPLGRMAGQGNSLELRKKKSMKFIEILVRCSKKNSSLLFGILRDSFEIC